MIKITIGLIDNTLETDNKTITSNNISNYCDINNILEEVDIVNLATFENNYFKLDGTFIFPQSNYEYNIGYESNTIFTGNEYIEIEFDNLHNLYGFVLRFKDNEYWTNFTTKFYNNDTLIDSIVSTNDETLFFKIITILNFNKVRFEINNIYNINHRVRLMSIILGISQVYDDDVITELRCSKATNLLAENSDNGAIEFSFYNTGGFDITTIADLPESIQKNVSVDCLINNVLFNKYKTTTTDVENEGKILKISGNDLLYNLGQSSYNKGIVYENGETLYNIAQSIASDCEISIVVDSSLNSIISYGYIGEVSHREAFRMIAEMGMCSLEIIDGVLNIRKDTSNNYENIEIINDSLNVSNNNKYDGIIVYGYNYSKSNDLVGLAESRDILLTGENQTIYIEYSQTPAIKNSMAYNNCTIIDEKYFSEHAEITINGTANNLAWITIIGYVYNVSNTQKKYGLDTNNKEIKNTLIKNPSDIIDFQWNLLKNSYQYTWEQIDELQLNDKVVIYDKNVNVSSVEYNADYYTIKGENYGTTNNE